MKAIQPDSSITEIRETDVPMNNKSTGNAMHSITKSLLVVSAALALSACSEELSTQAKKAAAEIAVEANKAATQKIEQVKTDAVGQLKNLTVEAETKREEKPGEADGKNSDEKSK